MHMSPVRKHSPAGFRIMTPRAHIIHGRRPPIGRILAGATRSIILLLISALCFYFVVVMVANTETLYVGQAKYTFSHAVNSQHDLAAALRTTTNIIEADVTLSDSKNVPIMAHPSATESDLALSDFLDAINVHNAQNAAQKRIIKLDFKYDNALNPSLTLIKQNWKGAAPWLNADILAGPGGVPPTVRADPFVEECVRLFPDAVLSLGWTVSSSAWEVGYTEAMVDDMIEVLDRHQLRVREVTFAVHAIHAMNSPAQMRRLLDYSPKTTLTVWGEADDEILSFFENFAPGRVYVDVKPMRTKVWAMVHVGRLFGLMK